MHCNQSGDRLDIPRRTIEEAVANLREATELYLEEFPLSSRGRSLITTFEVAVNA
jgi:predicted RNase H-like HicB family nuclease